MCATDLQAFNTSTFNVFSVIRGSVFGPRTCNHEIKRTVNYKTHTKCDKLGTQAPLGGSGIINLTRGSEKRAEITLDQKPLRLQEESAVL